MYNRISRLYSKRNHIDCYNIQESIGFFRSARKSLLSKLASLLLNVLCLAFCWVIRPFAEHILMSATKIPVCLLF